jgi:hypothetical protein
MNNVDFSPGVLVENGMELGGVESLYELPQKV